MELGKRIRDLRKKRGMTQAVLAKRSGLAQATISHLESGRNTRTAEIASIAKALGVSVEDILGSSPIPSDAPDDIRSLWDMLTDAQKLEQVRVMRRLVEENREAYRKLSALFGRGDSS